MGAGTAGCIVECNKVSKTVKGNYLLFFLPTSYTLIMFLKVLSLYNEN